MIIHAPFFPSFSRKIDGTRTPRDERRRAQHNEGEDKVWLRVPPRPPPSQAQPAPGCGVTEREATPGRPQVLQRALLDAVKVDSEQRGESTVSEIEGQGV